MLLPPFSMLRQGYSCIKSPRYIFTVSKLLGVHSLTKTSIRNGMKSIIMCDTKTRNCLSMSMMRELIKEIAAAKDDPAVRCVVISSEGSVFSSGHNLKELAGAGREGCAEVFSICSKLMNEIMYAPVPVLAAVNGIAAAAGCQVVAACDLAICSKHSSFSTPGIKRGLFCSTPGIPLVRVVPRKMAAYMLFTGESITSETALRVGLVTSVVDEEELGDEVAKIVKSISEQSREVIALGKKFFYEQIEMDINSAYRLGEKVMTDNIFLPDGQEGLRSFSEKRPPKWATGPMDS